MSLPQETIGNIPEETARVARAAFRGGNVAMRVRDELGAIYHDGAFATLFAVRGQPAESPWRLAFVTVLQFMEGLSDRQAADAVRSRIDWKYALALALEDPGFDFSVLAKFRARLLAGHAEHQLLDLLLERCTACHVLGVPKRSRTDSTHVLAAIRLLNRLECVGETLRAALNDLATVAPEWLRCWVPADWFERYSARFEAYRLPKGETERQSLAEQMGRDGFALMAAAYAAAAPAYLGQMPSMEVLRRTWIAQYWLDEGRVRWRKAGDLPPAGLRTDSPYDPEAHYATKRSTAWTGYKVHITETCDADQPHLITHVDTTLAATSDVDRTAAIQEALAKKALLPKEHLVDAGYVDADLLVTSMATHGVELVGPVRPNVSWQARHGHGYDVSAFRVDWDAQHVTCPQGNTSQCWTPHQDHWGNAVISVKFSHTDCRLCANRAACTKAKTAPRCLTLRPQADHQALHQARQRQATEEWQRRYHQRAGIEGTLAQGIRAFGLRRCRYIGLARTHLQHVATAAAINLVRLAGWYNDQPLAKTRTSRFAALAPAC